MTQRIQRTTLQYTVFISGLILQKNFFLPLRVKVIVISRSVLAPNFDEPNLTL